DSASQTRTFLSSPQVATRDPSGLKAAAEKLLMFPLSLARVLPVATSQVYATSNTEVSALDPSRLNTVSEPRKAGLSLTASCWPVVTLQVQASPWQAVNTLDPSGLNATAPTGDSGCLSLSNSVRSAASQTRAVLSRLAVATFDPSGLNVAAV